VTDLHVVIAKKLKLEGKSDIEVAEFFGIGERTLNNWKACPAFREAFQEIKQIIVAKALDKLNLVALGGIETETVVSVTGEKPKTITTRSKTLPDVRALTHLLAVMDPARYALSKVYSGTGEDEGASLARTKQSMEALISMTPHNDDMIGLLRVTPKDKR
jgi:hypothetical protein